MFARFLLVVSFSFVMSGMGLNAMDRVRSTPDLGRGNSFPLSPVFYEIKFAYTDGFDNVPSDPRQVKVFKDQVSGELVNTWRRGNETVRGDRGDRNNWEPFQRWYDGCDTFKKEYMEKSQKRDKRLKKWEEAKDPTTARKSPFKASSGGEDPVKSACIWFWEAEVALREIQLEAFLFHPSLVDSKEAIDHADDALKSAKSLLQRANEGENPELKALPQYSDLEGAIDRLKTQLIYVTPFNISAPYRTAFRDIATKKDRVKGGVIDPIDFTILVSKKKGVMRLREKVDRLKVWNTRLRKVQSVFREKYQEQVYPSSGNWTSTTSWSYWRTPRQEGGPVDQVIEVLMDACPFEDLRDEGLDRDLTTARGEVLAYLNLDGLGKKLGERYLRQIVPMKKREAKPFQHRRDQHTLRYDESLGKIVQEEKLDFPELQDGNQIGELAAQQNQQDEKYHVLLPDGATRKNFSLVYESPIDHTLLNELESLSYALEGQNELAPVRVPQVSDFIPIPRGPKDPKPFFVKIKSYNDKGEEVAVEELCVGYEYRTVDLMNSHHRPLFLSVLLELIKKRTEIDLTQAPFNGKDPLPIPEYDNESLKEYQGLCGEYEQALEEKRNLIHELLKPPGGLATSSWVPESVSKRVVDVIVAWDFVRFAFPCRPSVQTFHPVDSERTEVSLVRQNITDTHLTIKRGGKHDKGLGLFYFCSTVNLSNNNLVKITPAAFSGLLTRLILSHNRITDLTFIVGLLSHLKVLDVSHNLIPFLPSFEGCGESLVSLDISYNRLKEIDPLLCLGSLQTLDVTGNNFSTQVDHSSQLLGLGDLINLQTFSAEECQLKGLWSQVLPQHQNLRELFLSNNLELLWCPRLRLGAHGQLDLSANDVKFQEAFPLLDHLTNDKGSYKATVVEVVATEDSIEGKEKQPGQEKGDGQDVPAPTERQERKPIVLSDKVK